jgi:hypothetical protein
MRNVNVSVFLICVGILFPNLKVSAQAQGPLNPGTRINNTAGGAVAWITPNNSFSSDNSYSSATNGLSNFLSVSNFGFSIPASANITGIQLDVERKAAPVNPVTSGTWTTFTSPAYTSGTATALYGSTSYSYNLPIASATNNQRLLVVTVGIENVDNIAPTNPAIAFGTVTYNGVAMTLATSNSMASATTSNCVAVYYMVESNLPATIGSRALVISKTINGELSGGTISPAEYVEIVGVNVYTNVNQTTPVTAVSQTNATSPITSPMITNVRNGDYLVAATMNNTSGGASLTQGTGFTEHFEIPHNNTTTSGAILQVQSKSQASIVGIPAVTISTTASGASRLVMGAMAINSARVYDKVTTLTNAAGIQVGNNNAILPGSILGNAWPDADTYQTYGGSSDLWGTTWTPSTVNHAGFGMELQADALNSIASIDHIRITVYYSIPLGMGEEISMSATSTQTISGNETKVTVYPNPVTEYLIVESGEAINSLNITDATGKEVAVKINAADDYTYRIEQMPTKGFYNLIIHTSTGIISRKIVIN